MQLDLFEKYKTASLLTAKICRKTERGELMKEIMEVLNISRAGKFKPLSMGRMGLMLEKIPTDSLYTLVSKCKESGENARNKRKFVTEEEKRKMDTYESAYSKKFYWEIRVHDCNN